MKNAILLTFFSFLTASLITMASNPIATTQFYDTYNFLEEVTWVEDNGTLNGNIVQFLMNENTPIDQKAAVINALTVHNKIKNNAMMFTQFMARKYGEDFKNLDLTKLNSHELFCLGYLTLLDDDGNPEKALPILEMAVTKDQASETIATIFALAVGQQALNDGNQCAAWKAFEKVQNNSGKTDDMSSEMTATIATSLDPYKSACN